MRILIIIIALFAFTTTWANTGITAATSVEDKTVTVYFTEQQPQLLSISIIDRAGFELYSEKIQTRNLKSRKYNLKNLPFGKYTLKIESEQTITYKDIALDRNASSIVKENIIYKPNNTFSDNKWKLNLLAQNKKVSIRILNEKFEELYKETIEDQPVVSKAFDLSALPQGSYTLNIKIGKDSFNKEIAKI